VSSDARRLAEIERLYRARFPHFLRVARAITGDHEQALDAVQEGFGDAIRSRRTLRRDASLEAWVWRSVVNASRDARRADRATAELPADAGESTNGRVQPSDALRVALLALPERQRLVVFLRYYADLEYRSIAEALGIETGTVSATLNAAHRALRQTLQEVER
jgi:RNA polymerase sigma factor (sigma-70 family)